MTLSSPCPVTWWQLKPAQVPSFFKPRDISVLTLRVRDIPLCSHRPSSWVQVAQEVTTDGYNELYEYSGILDVSPSLFELTLTRGIGIKLYRRMLMMSKHHPSWVMHGVIGVPYPSLTRDLRVVKVGLLLAPILLSTKFYYPTEGSLLSTEECLNLNLPVWPIPLEPEPEIHRSTRFEREDVI
jgi:hypothetical protein